MYFPNRTKGTYYHLYFGNVMESNLFQKGDEIKDIHFDIRDYGQPGFDIVCTSSHINSVISAIISSEKVEPDQETWMNFSIGFEEGFEIAKKILAKDVYKYEELNAFIKSYGLLVGNYYFHAPDHFQQDLRDCHLDVQIILDTVDEDLKHYLTQLQQIVKNHIHWMLEFSSTEELQPLEGLIGELNQVIERDPAMVFPNMLKAEYYSVLVKMESPTIETIHHGYMEELCKLIPMFSEFEIKQMMPGFGLTWHPKMYLSEAQFLHASSTLMNQLLQEEQELVDLHERKNSIVEDYTHNWTNLLMPSNVYTSAKIIGENYPDELYHILMHVYNNEFLLKQQSYMLSLRHAHKVAELKNYIMESAIPADVEIKQKYPIEYFLGYACQLVLLRLFFDSSETFQRIRDNLFENGVDYKEIRPSFYRKVFGEKKSAIEWFSEEIYPITFQYVGNWKEVEVHPATSRAAFLIEILAELTLNALVYGKHSRQGSIEITLMDKTIVDRDFLSIRYTNSFDSIVADDEGMGLDALNELLLMTNSDMFDENDVSNYVHTSKENGTFITTVDIAEELLI